MKLIDKIQEVHSNKLSDYSKIYTPTAEVIEGIADEFAIEFASFLRRQCLVDDQYIYWWYKEIKYTEKQLLEIFKKEKGL